MCGNAPQSCVPARCFGILKAAWEERTRVAVNRIGANKKMYSPKEYWSSLAHGDNSVDATGFAPVLHPLAPPWFNQFIEQIAYSQLFDQRVLALAAVPPGALFLDLGCGTGRWV